MEDLYRWDGALSAGELIPPELLDEMFALHVPEIPELDGSPGYGYGWFLEVDDGRQMMWHTGGVYGFTTQIVRYPAERITIVILTNQQDSIETMLFARRFLMNATVRIQTGDGATIVFAGLLQVMAGESLAASFLVFGPDGPPVNGWITGWLVPPGEDRDAVRDSTMLSSDGTASLAWQVDLPPGTAGLSCRYRGSDYELAEVTVAEAP